MPLASTLRATLGSALALALSACSVPNNDHCGNQNGNATCLERDSNKAYCSICVADNNGCLAKPPPSDCVKATDSTTTGDPTSVIGTTTVDPPTSTTASSTSTTAPTTSTTTPLDTTTSTDTSTDTSTSTTDTTTGGPVCGNNKLEGDEVCDGTNFDGQTCKTVMARKWGGGSLTCNQCMSVSDTKCCVGLGGACGVLAPDAKLPCCVGNICKLDGVKGYKCM